MSDTQLQDDLLACAKGIDASCRCLTSRPLRAAIGRLDEQEKMIADLRRERDEWKGLVNAAERAAGMLSLAVDPSSTCLVDRCDELRNERADSLTQLAATRSLLRTAVDAWDRGYIAIDVGVAWGVVLSLHEWRNVARRAVDGKDGGA